MEKIELRPCTPEDVSAAVPLIIESGPAAFAYVFQTKKQNALSFLSFAFISKGGEFSYDNHFALMRNGTIVGIGSIFNGKRARGFALRDAMKVIRKYGFLAFTVMVRGLRVEQIVKHPKKNEFCIAHIGIRREERSKGYGQKMIELLMQTTTSATSDYYVLDVSEENPRAQLLYERMGFQVSRHIFSKLKNQYSYVPNHFRMELHPTITAVNL